MEQLIVVLSGKKQSGKSTVANFIKNEYEECIITIHSFADPLKEFCINVLGLTSEQCYGTDEEKNSIVPHIKWDTLPLSIRKTHDVTETFPNGREGNMTGRDIMQIFGTDIIRAMYYDAWARGTYNKIRKERARMAIIQDGRFPNEIDIGKEYNAKSIRLLRDVTEGDNHLSETALDDYKDFTVTIDNRNKSIEETNKVISELVYFWLEEDK